MMKDQSNKAYVAVPMRDVKLMDDGDENESPTAVVKKSSTQGRVLPVILPLLGIAVVALILMMRSCPLHQQKYKNSALHPYGPDGPHHHHGFWHHHGDHDRARAAADAAQIILATAQDQYDNFRGQYDLDPSNFNLNRLQQAQLNLDSARNSYNELDAIATQTEAIYLERANI
jgi:hypothetical protein